MLSEGLNIHLSKDRQVDRPAGRQVGGRTVGLAGRRADG